MAQAACKDLERCLKEILIITGEVEGWGVRGKIRGSFPMLRHQLISPFYTFFPAFSAVRLCGSLEMPGYAYTLFHV